MAKQTFTTGQVLTAAQMTSLQQTAMGGGAATAKTANYVLVAADAGTTVAMNAAGATTITVNTGLFAAGDTVFIQNLGAGACTVTAGTATVATAGSLILPQNDAGILYFTSASAAIFYDYIQAGAVSPLTTKGDLYTFSTSDARLGVGANGTTLVADSAEATGLKWTTPAAGALTFITSSTLGATTNVNNCFTSTYANYLIQLNITSATTNADVNFRLRASGSDAVTLYDVRGDTVTSTVSSVLIISSTNTIGYATITVAGPQIANKTSGSILAHGLNAGSLAVGQRNTFDHDASTQFDGFSIFSTATLTGTVRVYGYANA